MTFPLHFQVSERSKQLLAEFPTVTLLFIDLDHANEWRKTVGDQVAQKRLKRLGDSSLVSFSALDCLYYDRDEYLIWIEGSLADEGIASRTKSWLEGLGLDAPDSCTIVACELNTHSQGLGHLHQDLMIAMTNAKSKARGKIHRLKEQES